jgi:LytR cell envelope-related transcriptional attenuator
MNANPLRFGIILVLAIAGILVLANAFDGGGTTQAANPPSRSAVTASPSPKPTKTKEPKPKATESPKPTGTLDGVRIQVFNGTSTTGLAAAVQDKLRRREDPPPVVAGSAGNSNENQPSTVVYYRDKSDQANAEYAAKKYFNGADVKPISQIPPVNVNGVTTEVSKDVQVAIIVGEDSSA